MADRPEQAPRDEHLGDTKNIVRAIAWLLLPLTVVAIVLWGLGSVVGAVLFSACLFAWAVFAVYLVLDRLLIRSAGKLAGQIFLPSGSSTPGPKPLSHIEAMEARGDLDKAAAAYKAEIATDPADVISCERLGVLAQRRLHDYPLAAWAYREAERRADTPARRYGYGLLALGVYRDLLKDRGRTLVELRRLVEQYPTAPQVGALRAEIEQLKAELFEDSDA
jgi:tetratricopeptide (TPR) repeat protein